MTETVELRRSEVIGRGWTCEFGEGPIEGEEARRELGEPLDAEAAALGERERLIDMGGDAGWP